MGMNRSTHRSWPETEQHYDCLLYLCVFGETKNNLTKTDLISEHVSVQVIPAEL